MIETYTPISPFESRFRSSQFDRWKHACYIPPPPPISPNESRFTGNQVDGQKYAGQYHPLKADLQVIKLIGGICTPILLYDNGFTA